MLDGDEAATDTAVSQFRNSSPILMRPVYFPAILSPCYGLPLCNYILIPRLHAASLPGSPHSLFVSYCPRLTQLRISSLPLRYCYQFIRLSVVFLSPTPNVRASIGEQALRSFRNGARPLFTLSGDIVTYPRSSYPLPSRSLRGTFVPGLNYDRG